MSDRENETVADDVAAATPTLPTSAANGSGADEKPATKPRRSRSASKSRAVPAEPVPEEIEEMVAEGGPVGDEVERQQGVTDLPTEIVEDETPVLEAAHPELVGADDSESDSGSEPKAETAAAQVAVAKKSSSTRTRRSKTKDAKPAHSSSDPLLPGASNPSPDGSQVAYLLADATGSTRLWVTNLEDGSAYSIELPFRPVFDQEGPQWSPDGTTIALAGSAPSDVGTAIWLAPADGGTCVVLADHAASDEQPRWSPDGSLLAFSSRRHGRSAICVATPDGFGPVVQLTDGPIGQDDRNPCWEPNSQRIAYTRHMVDGEQTGDQVWTVSILTGEQKQVTKKLANRSQLQWCPGKSQVAFVTDEADWLNIGVVNPDNSAGWNLASEAGDKSAPRYSPDGNRIMYTRRVRGEVRLVERPTSGATADPLDPGAGVAASPSWLHDKRVVYQFASATDAPTFVIQDAKKEVARTFIPVAGGWTAQEWFVAPEHAEYEFAGNLKGGALVYRDARETAQMPAVVYMGENPNTGNTYSFDSTIQALVQNGFAVIVPTLPGTPGYGKKFVNALKDRAGTEAEISDLVDLANWTRNLEYVDSERLYLVGKGYGGALALLLPGARPGAADAVAVIDPVTDWDDELDQTDDPFAEWYLTYLGLPSANRGKTALRTPTTFAGVLDLPVLLIGTTRVSLGRSVQLERFSAALDELQVPYSRQLSENESTWETAERVAAFLKHPQAAEKVAQAASAADEDVPAEPDYVIEEVRTVDIEALLIGGDEVAPAAAEVIEDVIIEDDVVADETILIEEIPVAANGDTGVEPELDPEAELASSNVGRGMRTDDI